MAMTSLDRKLLSQIAHSINKDNKVMGSDLHTLLGLSVQLAKRVRTLDQYTSSVSIAQQELLAVRHHVLFLVKQGLQIVEARLLPFTSDGQFGAVLQVEVMLLRASLYHVLSVHHNISESTKDPSLDAGEAISTRTASATHSGRHEFSGHDRLDLEATTSAIATNASLITNPWLLHPTDNPSTSAIKTNSDLFNTGRLTALAASQQHTFLLPPSHYITPTSSYFATAALATTNLPGSHPLRLAVAVAHTKFLRQCMGETGRAEAIKVATAAVEAAWKAKGWGLGDEEFEDAAGCVRVLESLSKGVAVAANDDDVERTRTRMRTGTG